MFNNAKQYNVPGSGIWIDADTLHVGSPLTKGCRASRLMERSFFSSTQKLVQREFTTITGESPDMEVDQPKPAEDKPDPSSSKAPKTRPPALGKLLKTRLQKLYKMTDDEWVFLSTISFAPSFILTIGTTFKESGPLCSLHGSTESTIVPSILPDHQETYDI